MAYQLPQLKYSYDALEPYIDAKTMEIHHSKHHNTYVTKLNEALAGKPELEKKTPEELIANLLSVPEEIRTVVRNNGGGHINHTLFWNCLSPKGGGQPNGELAMAMKNDLGGFEPFKEKFTKAAAGFVGSGWTWLCVRDANLVIYSTLNHDNPIMDINDLEGTPILVLDIWEHAYYLKFQNRRPEYIAAFWNVVDWPAVEKRFLAAKDL